MRDETTQDGPVVYFIQADQGGPIKIGYCARRDAVTARLAALQTASPYKLLVRRLIDAPDGHHTEAAIHEQYAQYRLAGEWFLNTPEIAMMAWAPIPRAGDEGRLLEPIVRRAWEDGFRHGERRAELNARLALKALFDRALPWMFGDDDIERDLEVCRAEEAIAALVSQHEARQIRTRNAEYMRKLVGEDLGAISLPSRSHADATDGEKTAISSENDLREVA